MAKTLRGTFLAVTSAAGGTKGSKFLVVAGTVYKNPPATFKPYVVKIDPKKDG